MKPFPIPIFLALHLSLIAAGKAVPSLFAEDADPPFPALRDDFIEELETFSNDPSKKIVHEISYKNHAAFQRIELEWHDRLRGLHAFNSYEFSDRWRRIHGAAGYRSPSPRFLNQVYLGSFRHGFFERREERPSFFVDEGMDSKRSAFQGAGVGVLAGRFSGEAFYSRNRSEASGALFTSHLPKSFDLVSFCVAHSTSSKNFNVWGAGFWIQAERLNAKFIFSRNDLSVLGMTNRNFIDLDVETRLSDQTSMRFEVKKIEAGYDNPVSEIFLGRKELEIFLNIRQLFWEKAAVWLGVTNQNSFSSRILWNITEDQRLYGGQFYSVQENSSTPELRSTLRFLNRISDKFENQVRLEWRSRLEMAQFRLVYFWNEKRKKAIAFEVQSLHKKGTIALELKNRWFCSLELYLRYESESDGENKIKISTIYYFYT